VQDLSEAQGETHIGVVVFCSRWIQKELMYDSCVSASNLFCVPCLNSTTSEDQPKYALGPLMAGFTDELKHWWMAAVSEPQICCGMSADLDGQICG
jgi:hypothetical protein